MSDLDTAAIRDRLEQRELEVNTAALLNFDNHAPADIRALLDQVDRLRAGNETCYDHRDKPGCAWCVLEHELELAHEERDEALAELKARTESSAVTVTQLVEARAEVERLKHTCWACGFDTDGKDLSQHRVGCILRTMAEIAQQAERERDLLLELLRRAQDRIRVDGDTTCRDILAEFNRRKGE